MFLQIKQLSKSYGSRQVVSNVDLTMEEGEILSLLGPSGCGKTTILRMIAGLVSPESGWIEIGGRVVYDGRKEVYVEERRLGMVFQDYALWPHMTVARNIAFGLRLRHTPAQVIAKRVAELLELVNLPGMEDRYPYQLSGGQQQRVAVARALATEPRLLLLDEPLSSLDTGLREVMRTELVQLFKRLKITTINVTHDQDEAMAMSDRIMVLRDGQVQQIGTPTELYLNPCNVFVASFMGPANLLAGELVPEASGVTERSIRLKHLFAEEKVVSGLVRDEVRPRLNGRGSLLCRPDDVSLHLDTLSPGQLNLLPGKILHSSFVAGRWRTVVSIGERQTQPLLAFASSQLQAEQPVWLELPPERCQIVPE
ncbi:ABC transporter ATP-binding protein [Ktedonosporobacter rubrisoli]|uniref:ABC-type quaternary amine transporter n=1 Tax=Ktedonosporobacter rubrisoli TaxID=2509675 RepID=A0A4P6JWM8_KTERU|nr:ABC transporter ATP-binding protein [Ktedonosporobacter rubrisoli]QBD79790.1 ABC transporter ATP-binding protein [Ktedonosporobacter rubrisoli]